MEEHTNAGKNHFVYSFPRLEGEEIRLTIREYQKRLYVDLRVWFQPPDGPELRPTRKGLWIKLSQLHELEKGVSELIQAAAQLKVPPQKTWRQSDTPNSNPQKRWNKN